jgi:hypothetical protein
LIVAIQTDDLETLAHLVNIAANATAAIRDRLGVLEELTEICPAADSAAIPGDPPPALGRFEADPPPAPMDPDPPQDPAPVPPKQRPPKRRRMRKTANSGAGKIPWTELVLGALADLGGEASIGEIAEALKGRPEVERLGTLLKKRMGCQLPKMQGVTAAGRGRYADPESLSIAELERRLAYAKKNGQHDEDARRALIKKQVAKGGQC